MRPAADLGKIGYLDYSSLCSLNSMFFEFLLVFAGSLLVWCDNGHASKNQIGDWIPMGWHFRTMSGTDPFVIDQTVTVAFGKRPQPWVAELLAEFHETLAAHGGTAGILREQVPPPLDGRDYVDALVVSTENTLSEALLPGTANP